MISEIIYKIFKNQIFDFEKINLQSKILNLK